MKRLHVTMEDIYEGVPGDAYSCPIAHAIKRRLGPGLKRVEVTPSHIWIEHEYYTLPQKATDFVNNFDTGQDVKPFIFTLNRHDQINPDAASIHKS